MNNAGPTGNLNMNSSNTRRDRKPITLYCSQPTQTQESELEVKDSEGEDSDSDFPPCRIGKSPPLMSRSPFVPSNRYHQSASGHDSNSPPNMGLGQRNILNTVNNENLKVCLLYSLRSMHY